MELAASRRAFLEIEVVDQTNNARSGLATRGDLTEAVVWHADHRGHLLRGARINDGGQLRSRKPQYLRRPRLGHGRA